MKRKVVKKKNILSLLLIVIISAVIISLITYMAVKPIPQTKTIAVQSVSSQIMADGTIASQNQAVLHFQTGGKLVYLPVKEGDTVYQGQTIASLDSTVIQKQLAQALNTYRSARDTFDQTQQNNQTGVLQGQQKYTLNLQNKDISGDQQFSIINDMAKRILDQNQANLDNAVLNVEIVNQSLQLATLTAPISGIVTHMDVSSTGVNVGPTTSFVIADPQDLVFRAQVLENDIDFINAGAQVTVKIGNGNGRQFPGNVSKIYPDKTILPNGVKVYQVDIASPELLQYGKMGQSGIALIQTNTKETMRLIPTWTILNHNSVWVFADGMSVLRTIKIGKTHGSVTEVTEGLLPGDQVIINPESIAGQKYRIL